MISTSMRISGMPSLRFPAAFALAIGACQPALLVPSTHRAAGGLVAHDTDWPPHQRGRGYIPELPFLSGDIDFFDLAAIYAGAPFEGRCSPIPEGTWRNVAAQMRERYACEDFAELAAEPSVSPALAACANELFSVGLLTSCSELSVYGEYRSPSCDAAQSAFSNRHTSCYQQ
jgi:hypothetical protein